MSIIMLFYISETNLKKIKKVFILFRNLIAKKRFSPLLPCGKHFQNYSLMGRNGKDSFRFSFFYFPGWTLLFGELRKVSKTTETMAQDVTERQILGCINCKI